MSEDARNHWIHQGDIVYWVPDNDGTPRDGDRSYGLVMRPRRRDEGWIVLNGTTGSGKLVA